MLYNFLYRNIPTTNTIKVLQNSEKGVCYIFGDGKSLRYYDLSSFSDFPSITMGNVSLLKQSKFLNLKYSIFCDSFCFFPGRHFYDYWLRIKEALKNKYYEKLLNLISLKKIFNLFFCSTKKLLFTKNEPLLNSNIITHCSNYYFTRFLDNSYYYNNHLKVNNSIDLLNEKKINFYSSSFRFSIYFAVFLGFKKIYLVGCDYHDIQPMVGHWWENDKPKSYSGKQDNVFIDFMRNFIDIKIITQKKSNGTDYISYKDFSGKNLDYKENNEVTKNEKLDILEKTRGL